MAAMSPSSATQKEDELYSNDDGAYDGAPEPQRFLRGWRLDLARFTWVVALFASVICFISGLPRSFQIASTLSPIALRRLAQMGLPPTFSAWYLIILDTATLILFITAAIILFRKRSEDTLALVAAYMLLFTGMLYTAPGYEARIPMWLIALGAAAAEFFQVAFLLLFPDGHFRPRWTWMILPPLAIWRYYIWSVFYIPWLYAAYRSGDRYPFLRQDARDLVLFFVIIVVAVVLQVIRYRRNSTPAQQLQAKWLVWATSMAVIIVGAYVIGINALPSLHPRLGSSVVMTLAGRTVRQVALSVIPLAILYSVLRRRLWNIDFLINRTLVYVPLTSLLAGIFAVAVVVTQRFMLAATGSKSDWTLIVVTILITSIINPIRLEMQKWVDTRFKEAPDPLQALRRFDKDVQNIADILAREPLMKRLVDEAVCSLDASGGAAFHVGEDGPRLVYATPRWRGPIALLRPLTSGGQCAGWFALGAKFCGDPYSEVECKGLEDTMTKVSLILVLMHGNRTVETIGLDAAGIGSETLLPLLAQEGSRERSVATVLEGTRGVADAQPLGAT